MSSPNEVWLVDRHVAELKSGRAETIGASLAPFAGLEMTLYVKADRSDPSREAMREALEAVLRFAERNHCTHEETRRLGAIWTECTGCGRKWADDEGGMPEYREPDEFIAARAALALDGDAK